MFTNAPARLLISCVLALLFGAQTNMYGQQSAKVDRLAPGDAVLGRADVDGHMVHGEQATRMLDRVPVGVERRRSGDSDLGPGHERDVVRRIAASQPRGDQVIFVEVGNDSLDRLEPHDLLVEPLQRSGVFGRDHGVVDPRDSDSDQVTRECIGIDQPDVRADAFGLGVQLDDMYRGYRH